MADEIPLGQKEDLHLEFKGRDALKKLETIGREVVAMLNAEGGEVWIGLRDEEDRAVEIDAIPSPDPNRLLNYLVDTIEPSPAGHEIQVRTVAVQGGGILCVTAQPGERKPYAHLKEGGRFFVTRVGNRLRPMGREEVAEFFYKARYSSKTDLEKATSKVLDERSELQGRGLEQLWICMEPVSEVTLDLQELLYDEILCDPRLVGDRMAGWNFSTFEDRPKLRKDKRITHEDLRMVEIRRDGGLRFSAPLSMLYFRGDETDLWPQALLELPASAFRIARKIYEGKLDPQAWVVCDLALIGVGGWKLRPYTTTSRGKVTYEDSSDLVFDKPLAFSVAQIEAEPDRCGFRLIERVYEAFGFRREALLQQFNWEAGRLALTE